MTGILEAPKKTTVIRLRWPVVIICSYLLANAPGEWLPTGYYHVFLVFYILSNCSLYFVPERYFDSIFFYIPLVIFDTFVLTSSLMVSGQAGTMFYLSYFLIIVLCTIWQDIRGSIGIAVLISILYGLLLYRTTGFHDPGVYVRFTFLFVVSIFYGYFTHVLRAEKVQNEEAEAARLRSITSLAAGVAHEVKNPLAILLQGVDYLNKKLGTEDKNLALVLKNMHEAVTRADSIVRGLMDFSTLKQLKMLPENLNSIIEDSLMLVKNHLDRNQIEVVRELKGEIPRTSLDRNRIEQVFINLFMNAVEAMPNGGTLWVSTHIENHQKDREVLVAKVENSGDNIRRDVLRHIFEPFVTTKRGIGGTGLGLSVVKNIIDMHHGRIQVSNRERGGVCVTLGFKTEALM
ncbi:MAG: GHKL domain-containing protein [Deltaproteobacteria bacterium]|nr:GHKL domain-containing protein [Deltaproteobacteria bacterium]